MMTETEKVVLTVPAAVVAAYAAKGEARKPRRKAETEMATTLKEASGVDFAQRPLYISPDTRRELEAIWETTIENDGDLLALVKALARVQMEDVEIVLTEHEVSQIAAFASFHGEEPSDYARRVLHDAVRHAIGEY